VQRGTGDEIEAALTAGGEGASDKLCLELTNVCEGIEWKKPNLPGYEGYVPPEPKEPDAKPKMGKKKKKKKKGTDRPQAASKDEL